MSDHSTKSDLEARTAADPGEDMNVRHIHAAIWREGAEPAEVWRRTPVVLRHFYFIMIVILILYLTNWMGGWSWHEYEESSIQRGVRDRAREAAEAVKADPH
ncbi:MAG: hypothetical protein ABI680_01985 [Chthoniobacteraceae bacterium]